MNKNIDKNNLNEVISISKKILKLFYIILIFVGAYVLLKIIKEMKILHFIISILKLLAPLFIGIIIAWLFNPFVKWLEKKGVRRSIGTVGAFVVLIACLVLIIEALIPLLYNQTLDLVGNIPNISVDVKKWISDLFNNVNFKNFDVNSIETSLLSRLDIFAGELSTKLPSIIINFISAAISGIGTFVIGLIIGFFLLLSCDDFGKSMLNLLPKKYRKGVGILSTRINQSLRNYVNGAMIDSCVVIIASSIAFAIIGLKSPLLFGLFCGLMNVIPYAGPYIGGAPAVIVGLSQGTGLGIAVLIAIIIIQTIEGNVLQTLIMSKTTKLNPIIIILGLLVFGHFFGIVGMLLSTPIIGVIKIIYNYFDEKYDFLNFD